MCVPLQPSVMYYMWRTLATVLDDFHPAEFEATFTEQRKSLWFTFQRAICEKMVAVWLDHQTSPNEIAEARSDLTLPGMRPSKLGWWT